MDLQGWNFSAQKILVKYLAFLLRVDLAYIGHGLKWQM